VNPPEPSAKPSAEPPALHLCAAAAIEERGRAWVWDVLEYGRPARAFALRFDGELRAYMNRCVHVPAEMDWQPGEFFDLDKRWILCSIHGATYEPANGRCVGGPCGRGRLTPVRVQERDGEVYWYPSRDIRPLEFDPPTPESPA
jgi:nitrite reductase/ring-hydroxylating ferredoxin subunit